MAEKKAMVNVKIAIDGKKMAEIIFKHQIDVLPAPGDIGLVQKPGEDEHDGV